MSWKAGVEFQVFGHGNVGSMILWLIAHHLFFAQLAPSHTMRHVTCTSVDTQPSHPDTIHSAMELSLGHPLDLGAHTIGQSALG